MYEGGLRVPFAARWPGHVQPGSRSDRMALTMDLFPTVLEAAGVTPPKGIDGLSILPALLGQTTVDPRPNFYFVWREGGILHGGGTVNALRQGDWKLLQDSPFAPLELYNLKEDPKETTNRATEERKTLLSLDAELRKQIQRGGATPWQPPEK
jgi:arylsulfatase A-like enzyme